MSFRKGTAPSSYCLEASPGMRARTRRQSRLPACSSTPECLWQRFAAPPRALLVGACSIAAAIPAILANIWTQHITAGLNCMKMLWPSRITISSPQRERPLLTSRIIFSGDWTSMHHHCWRRGMDYSRLATRNTSAHLQRLRIRRMPIQAIGCSHS